MNKENTDKLLNIIDLLDKITKNSEEKHKIDENKIVALESSEKLETFESLKKKRSVFPLNFSQAASSSNSASKFLKNIKSRKTFFYLNKSTLTEDGSAIDINGDILKKELSIYSSDQDEYSKFYELIGMNLAGNSDEESEVSANRNKKRYHEERTDDSLDYTESRGISEIEIEQNTESEIDIEQNEEKKKNTESEEEKQEETGLNRFFSNKKEDDQKDVSNTALGFPLEKKKKTIQFKETDTEDNIMRLNSRMPKRTMSRRNIEKKMLSRKMDTLNKSRSKMIRSKTIRSKMSRSIGSKSNTSNRMCSIKMQSDFALIKRKTSARHMLKPYCSDTHLLTYKKFDSGKKMFFQIWRKQRKSKYKMKREHTDNVLSQKSKNKQKLKKAIQEKFNDNNEYLDHTIIGHLFERIIETLNVNLKNSIQTFVTKINKLKQEKENLKNKLETAVENNDEQAQEIRDLNKRVKSVQEQKLELHKIVETYEQEIDEYKLLENKVQNNLKNINSLEQENKNVKKQLNNLNTAYENLKNEATYLKEKVNIKNQQLQEESKKLLEAKDIIIQKDELISHLQMLSKIKVDEQKETTFKKKVYTTKIKHKITNSRYQSDTILTNYERIRLKLFDSNERSYFLSKTNLELFKGLKSKIKKTQNLKEELLFHKEALVKTKTKFDNIVSILSKLTKTNDDLYAKILEYTKDMENQKQLNFNACLEKNQSFEKMMELSDAPSEQPNKYSSSSSSSGEINNLHNIIEIGKLKELLDKKTNEYNLLQKKYENLYKKYISLIQKSKKKNKDFTFIKHVIEEEEEEEPPIIHSFFVEDKTDTCSLKKLNQDKLTKFIKALVVHKNTDIKKFKNFKEESIYRDVECYISNEFINKINTEDIMNIRYLYSYGSTEDTNKEKGGHSFLRYITCKE